MSRVLVVDDDKSVRTAIQTILEHNGFDVVVAQDGPSGVQAVRNSAFDVVIIDIFMPGMDGLETIRVFNKHAPEVPIIAISGFMFRDSAKPAPNFLSMSTKLGAAYSLAKPFRPKDLLRAVEICLARRVEEQSPSPARRAGMTKSARS